MHCACFIVKPIRQTETETALGEWAKVTRVSTLQAAVVLLLPSLHFAVFLTQREVYYNLLYSHGHRVYGVPKCVDYRCTRDHTVNCSVYQVTTTLRAGAVLTALPRISTRRPSAHQTDRPTASTNLIGARPPASKPARRVAQCQHSRCCQTSSHTSCTGHSGRSVPFTI